MAVVRVPLAVASIALLGLTAAAGSYALALTSDHVPEPGIQASLMAWITLPYVLAGLVAWHRRPDSRFGVLMVVAGFTVACSTLAWSDADVPHTVGQAVDLLPAVVFLHLFLAFPDGRLEGRAVRALVGVGYGAAVGGELVGLLFGGYGPDNLLEVVAAPQFAEHLLDVQLVVISGLCLAGVAVLHARRRASPPLRRSIAVVQWAFSIALAMTAALFLTGALDLPWFETLRRATFFALGLVPCAYLFAVGCQRLARGLVGELVVELRERPNPADLRDGLARALRDPSLRLAYWLPDFDSWADLDGRAIVLPGPGDDGVTRVGGRDGGPVAALLHDPSLQEEPELLDAVSAAAGIALENGRLHAELLARLDELRGSRERVALAGQRERQRLERDLHDGAQQRLIALSLELALLEKRFGPDPRFAHARSEIARSLDELRDVAHGLHPAVVSGHGLAVALESLAVEAPLPVELRVQLDRRLPEPLEVAAYYVAAESLANVGKHAHASEATVTATASGGRLVVEIIDDGIGGADTDRGTGLRGLADRVETLGGRLRVWSPAGSGTRVRAEVPCGR